MPTAGASQHQPRFSRGERGKVELVTLRVQNCRANPVGISWAPPSGRMHSPRLRKASSAHPVPVLRSPFMNDRLGLLFGPRGCSGPGFPPSVWALALV